MSSAIVASRLAPDASLAVFRTLLDAVSHPGRPFSLVRDLCRDTDRDTDRDTLLGDLPMAALPLLSLADIDVTIAVVGPRFDALDLEAPELGRRVARSTGARLSRDIGVADLVLAGAGTTSGDLLALRVGSHDEPERGAKLFAACDVIHVADGHDRTHDEPLLSIRVAGPGASAGRDVRVSGLDRTVVEFLAALNGSFPAGVDTWIVAMDGTVVAIPRSCSISLTQGAH